MVYLLSGFEVFNILLSAEILLSTFSLHAFISGVCN